MKFLLLQQNVDRKYLLYGFAILLLLWAIVKRDRLDVRSGSFSMVAEVPGDA